MKKNIIVALLLILSSCTFTKQQKAEKLVKNYLNDHLNDPHSYESVSFTQLEPRLSRYELSEPEGRRLDAIDARFYDSSKKYRILYKGDLSDPFTPPPQKSKYTKYYITMEADFIKKQDSIEKIIKEKSIGYKPPILDYTIDHTYRAKNGFGALGLQRATFILNKACDSIINVIDSQD